MKEKYSTDTLLYKITQYIYYFLTVNFYFLLSNTLLLVLLLFFPISLSNILVYGLGLIPTGPSITALFYTMGKLYREKSINPTRDYWSAYKKNIRESSKYWLIVLPILLVLTVDVLFVLNRGWWILTGVSILLLLLILVSALYGFSILARFEVSLKNLFIFSVLLLFQNKLNSLSHLSLLIAFSFILYGFFTYAILFIFSIAGYYFMRNNHDLLDKMENNYSQLGENES